MNAVWFDGSTALGYSSMVAGDRADMVAMLLRRGARLWSNADGSRSPLHDACLTRNALCVRTLLAGGASPNTSTAQGYVLAIAVERGYYSVARELLVAGADRSVKALNGDSLHSCAQRAPCAGVQELLAQASPVGSLRPILALLICVPTGVVP